MSINFASDVKQFQADQVISNLLENKSDLNKVEVSLLQKEKIEKEFFLEAIRNLTIGQYAFTNIGIQISMHI